MPLSEETVGGYLSSNCYSHKEGDNIKTTTYNYDNGGNILSKTVYDYTTGSLDGLTGTVVQYTYGDSFHIRTLILTMIYHLMPTLIECGRVFIAETPLYEINTKDMPYFAYDENEKKDILDKIGDAKYNLQRSKGLGENQPDMMNLTTMNPTTRRLVKILPEDAALTSEMFDLFWAIIYKAERNIFPKTATSYLEDADIS